MNECYICGEKVKDVGDIIHYCHACKRIKALGFIMDRFEKAIQRLEEAMPCKPV